jgi:hypothetical protein
MSKDIGVKKTIFTIFFPDRKLLIIEYFPKGEKYSQDYFIPGILPELEREKTDPSGRSKVGVSAEDFKAYFASITAHLTSVPSKFFRLLMKLAWVLRARVTSGGNCRE